LDDDKSKREVVGLSIIRYLYAVLDAIPMIHQELEIVEYREKLEKNAETKEMH
jgi:hypothetical protein